LFSHTLLGMLKNSIPDCWIGSVIEQKNTWLLDHHSAIDQIFPYKKSPEEIRHQLFEEAPDYLIDLIGGGKTRRFKNKLGVMDFSLKHRLIKLIANADSPAASHRIFKEAMVQLLSVFEIKELSDTTGIELPLDATWLGKVLPSEMISSYVFLDLELLGSPESIDPMALSETLGMLEHPVVLSGPAPYRILADSMIHGVGCSLFNTCGDFTEKERLMLLTGSKALAGSGGLLDFWTFVGDKTSCKITKEGAEYQWSKDLNLIRKTLKA